MFHDAIMRGTAVIVVQTSVSPLHRWDRMRRRHHTVQSSVSRHIRGIIPLTLGGLLFPSYAYQEPAYLILETPATGFGDGSALESLSELDVPIIIIVVPDQTYKLLTRQLIRSRTGRISVIMASCKCTV
jgi:hypothetical protein